MNFIDSKETPPFDIKDYENNPYYQEDRKLKKNFVIVKPVAYENEFVEDFILNKKKELLLLRIIFVGILVLIYALF